MIPTNGVSTKDIEMIVYPTHTYKLDFDKNKVTQYTNGLAAMEQMVYKALQTHRYRHEIYSWNYGIELDDLFGKPTIFIKSELVRRITECLMADDRVNAVDGFQFPEPETNVYNDKRTTVHVIFTVHSIFGNITITKDVSLQHV